MAGKCKISIFAFNVCAREFEAIFTVVAFTSCSNIKKTTILEFMNVRKLRSTPTHGRKYIISAYTRCVVTCLFYICIYYYVLYYPANMLASLVICEHHRTIYTDYSYTSHTNLFQILIKTE